MRRIQPQRVIVLLSGAILFSTVAQAATKVHVIALGKQMSVPWSPQGKTDDKPLTLKIRPLIVDGRIREYMLASPHDVTERLFVVRRAFRVNDSLPEESAPIWQWQRGGWLLVDRATGRVSPINLPEFDTLYSAAGWYQDYVAYCGVSDDDEKIYAIVVQLGRRKPVLKKPLSNEGLPDDAAPDSACRVPSWQRNPTRVSFEPPGGTKQTFAIRGHAVDVVSDEEEEESK